MTFFSQLIFDKMIAWDEGDKEDIEFGRDSVSLDSLFQLPKHCEHACVARKVAHDAPKCSQGMVPSRVNVLLQGVPRVTILFKCNVRL